MMNDMLFVSFLLTILSIFSNVAFGEMDETRLRAIEDSIRQQHVKMENAFRQQDAKIEAQSIEIASLKKMIVYQNKVIDSLGMTVAVLSRNQNGQRREITLLKSLIQRPIKRADDATQNGEQPDVDVEISEVAEIDVSNAKKEKRLLTPVPTSSETAPRVAFHAYLSHRISHPSPGHIIVFDGVTIDLQNGYNKHNGMFTAPVDGIYAFFFTIRIQCEGRHSVQLMQNSAAIEVIYLHNTNCAGQMETGTSIASLHVGDVVYVRVHDTDGGSGDLYNDEGGRAHFTGYLVYPGI